MAEEDMRKRRVVQQDTGDRESWRRRAVKELANPHQDNKLMMIMITVILVILIIMKNVKCSRALWIECYIKCSSLL